VCVCVIALSVVDQLLVKMKFIIRIPLFVRGKGKGEGEEGRKREKTEPIFYTLGAMEVPNTVYIIRTKQST